MEPTLQTQISDYVQQNAPRMKTVLVVRNGYIVLEEYYEGNQDEALAIVSITKPIVGALVGIAIDQRHLQSVDQKAVDFFPEHAASVLDPRVNQITLEHLLTHTAGLWGDFTDVGTMLEWPLERDPGQRYEYGPTGVNLLTAILAKATGMSALEYGDKHLFGPLGISTPHWDADDEGNLIGARGLHLRPRDLAKFGYLFVRKGTWEGKQIVPAEWIEESTRKHADMQPTGASAEYDLHGCGYLWPLKSVDEHPAYLHAGGGPQAGHVQLLYVIPDLEIVVVVTSVFEDLSQLFHIVEEVVVPAVLE